MLLFLNTWATWSWLVPRLLCFQSFFMSFGFMREGSSQDYHDLLEILETRAMSSHGGEVEVAPTQLSPHQSPDQSEPESTQPKKQHAAHALGKPKAQPKGKAVVKKPATKVLVLLKPSQSPKEEKHNKTEKPGKTKKEKEEKKRRNGQRAWRRQKRRQKRTQRRRQRVQERRLLHAMRWSTPTPTSACQIRRQTRRKTAARMQNSKKSLASGSCRVDAQFWSFYDALLKHF